MAGKVFHVSDSVHKMVAKHCKDNNLVLKEWVESTLTRGVMSKLVTDDSMANVILNSVREVKQVPKKKLVRATESDGDDPWVKPPFWKNNG